MPEQHDAPACEGATAGDHVWRLRSTVCASDTVSRAARARDQADTDRECAQLQDYLSTSPDGAWGARSPPRWRRGKNLQARDMAVIPRGKAHEHSGVPCHWSDGKTEQARDFLRGWGILADCFPLPALELSQEDFSTEWVGHYLQTLA